MGASTETEFALRNWRHGQTFAERLGAHLLHLDGYEAVDPQCPLGGPDGSKDIICSRNGAKWIGAVYFPATEKTYGEIKAKFIDDLSGAVDNDAEGFAFLVNQRVTPLQRRELQALGTLPIEIYHVERISGLLNAPKGFGARLEYLGIQMSLEEQIGFFNSFKSDFRHQLAKHASRFETQINSLHDKLDRIARTYSKQGDVTLSCNPGRDVFSFVHAMDMPTSRLSLSMLSWLHRVATENSSPSAMRGRLRRTQNWLASMEKPREILYLPPPPEEVPERLNQFLTWWRELHPTLFHQQQDKIIGSLAHFHHRFLQIHPFPDGNGRLARILLDQAATELLGRESGARLLKDPTSYYTALRCADQGNYVNLRRLIADTLE